MQLVKFKNGMFGVRRRVASTLGYEFRDLDQKGFWWQPDSIWFGLCKGTRQMAEGELKRLQPNGKSAEEPDDFEGWDFGEVVKDDLGKDGDAEAFIPRHGYIEAIDRGIDRFAGRSSTGV